MIKKFKHGRAEDNDFVIYSHCLLYSVISVMLFIS